MVHLKNNHLRMSAREMLTFVTYFPLLVGDLVPSEDNVWEFILLLIEIIDTVLLFEITNFTINSFEINIERHNNMFIQLFKKSLKPKYHILTHYPEVMKECGPIRKFWSFHFEARHRIFKNYARSITSRINVGVSMARKYQFFFANHLLSDYSSNIKLSENDISVCHLTEFISSKLKQPKDLLKIYDKAEYKNILYKNNFFVAMRNIDYIIYKILKIVICDNCPYLFVQKMNNTTYLKHYTAFEIQPDNLGEFDIISTTDIVGPPVTLIKTHRSKFMVRLKETC